MDNNLLNELKFFAIMFSIIFIVFIIINIFSYRKLRGYFGFLDTLFPFFKSFNYPYPQKLIDYPILRITIYSSLYVAFFFLSVGLVSKSLVSLI